ncbi:ABC transporter ATP-binding protein [Xylanimonas oleitrophica]|uniref:ABC transporter ATP-binding protein n=1 Tax=Xylanimonas oleitrophica TaxID=2607479 RepID=A0A2W5WWB1_9MICO|nr:ABC transporter ATP-binding protein [Xylanimonas oleitrophica]PZR52115.1 ABC transporter ATP-binding protein [Xylanimonas oleitrophica]
MTSQALISVSGARRRYGSFEAVRGADLVVRRGELVALLGTNGAGKTSLVELIEGLAPADGGEVRVLGKDPYAQRREIVGQLGVMLQEAGFSPDLTVVETARMWAGTLTSPRPVAEALDVVNLAHRADVRVASLSGGERRRLDLALAVMGRPQVLFLDEPTTGLDPESRRATWDLVRGLLAEGTTVLLTTHYLEEAEELADRIAIMHAGRIVTEGTVAEIVAAEPARIEFVPQDAEGRLVEVAPADLPALSGAVGAPEVERSRVRLRTDRLQDDLEAVLAWARARGLRLADLDARSASLEQAFLSVAGTTAGTAGPDTPSPDASEEVAA